MVKSYLPSLSRRLNEFLRGAVLRMFGGTVLKKDFDEAYYFKAYPDVAGRIEEGEFSSAIDHYVRLGRSLGYKYNVERRRFEPKDVPVALFVFNRPGFTRLVFSRIREFRPSTLLLVADGPRTPMEESSTSACRKILEEIDWPCEVLRNYSSANMGCKERLATGLKWIFENVEESIILEDDCLPHPDFFPFASHMLYRYRNHPKVMHVCGSNFFPQPDFSSDYWFSRHSDIWGWATWKRAFKYYDADMTNWATVKARGVVPRLVWPDLLERQYWSRMFDETAAGNIDTWDYQWHWTVYQRRGLTVVPRVNLITNMGHDAAATHTRDSAAMVANLAAKPLNLKRPPPVVKALHPDEDRVVFVLRYYSMGQMEYSDVVEAEGEPLRVVVSHDAPTWRQGVGALICKTFGSDLSWMNVRSRDAYAGFGESPVPSVKVGAADLPMGRARTFGSIGRALSGRKITAVLAVPFTIQDCLNALAVAETNGAKLGVWIMDDQNIFSENIPDDLLRELFRKSAARWAICEKMARAYSSKFEVSFDVLMPVEREELLCRVSVPDSGRTIPSAVGCGNVWSRETAKLLMNCWTKTGLRLDWYGEFGHPFLHQDAEMLASHGIFRHPTFGRQDDFVNRLREYDFAVVPMPPQSCEGHKWQGALSFPSKIVTFTAACNLPVFYLGNADSPGGEFILRSGAGFVSEWNDFESKEALSRLARPQERTEIRNRLAAMALEFSSEKLPERIWAAIEGGAVQV